MKPTLLDLFCKAGGCSMGYARAGFEVTGVDIEVQPHYPFNFIQADAMTFSLEGYDVVTASPPCPFYSSITPAAIRSNHPDLIGKVRARLEKNGKPWVIENVPGAPMLSGLVLCGSMFDLPVRRHRHFESNCFLFAPRGCNHRGQAIGIYGEHIRIVKLYGHPGPKYENFTLEGGRKAMGIDWMNRKELCQAIPPAYTEWIGKQLFAYL